MELFIVIVDRLGQEKVKYTERLETEYRGGLARTIYENPRELKGLMAMGYSTGSYIEALQNAQDLIIGMYEIASEAKARLGIA